MSSNSNQLFSAYHEDWALIMKKMIAEHENNSRVFNTSHKHVNTRSVHKKRMKLFQGVRKLYLFINRTKLQYFSFQPRIGTVEGQCYCQNIYMETHTYHAGKDFYHPLSNILLLITFFLI